MKILLRIGLALVAGAAIAVTAAVILLPRVLESDAVRSRIQAAANDAVGSEVSYRALAVGIFPPSLKAIGVTVAAATPQAPDLVEAEEVALRVSLMPLLARVVVVDSFRVDGLVVRLVRTGDGIAWPVRAVREPEEAAAEADPGGAGIDLAVAAVDLSGATIELEDRTVTPPATWTLRDLALHARGESLEEPVEFSLSFDLGSGGTVDATGTATLAGDVDVEAQLQGVSLAPARGYIAAGGDFAGRLTGSVKAVGPATDLASLVIDVVVDDSRIEIGDTSVDGTVAIRATIEHPVRGPKGRFDVDATDAEVRYGGAFTKPSGVRGTVTCEVVRQRDGRLGCGDVHLKVKKFEANGKVSLGDRTRIVLNAPPFELDGWEELIPSLGGYDLSGPARLDDLAVTTAPMDVRGAIVLDGVTGVLPERGPVRIDGSLVGAGDTISGEDLRIVAADQVIGVSVSVSELDRDLRYRVQLETTGADTNRLVSTFTSKRDFVYGLLNLTGSLQGTAAGARSPLETVTGRFHLNIDKGRLKGVSLLQLTFDQFGSLGNLAQLASVVLGGPDLSPFYQDDFKEIRGNFEVGGGHVRTDDFRIVYRDYSVDLRGSLRLVDLGIDMTGTLTIGDRIEMALRRPQANAPDTIRLARVTGTLDDPQVQVAPEAVTAFLGRTGASRKLDDVIDRAAGEGASELLKGILGGTIQRR